MARYVLGHTDDAIAHHGALDAGEAYRQKSFTPTVLARRVQEMLDGPGRTCEQGKAAA
jgi:hypothetical protein